MASHQNYASHLPPSSDSTATSPSTRCCRAQAMKRLREVPQYLHLIAIPILCFLAAVAVHTPTPAHALAIVAVCLAAIGIKVNGKHSEPNHQQQHNYYYQLHQTQFNSRSRVVISLLFATAYAFTADFTAATLLWSAPADESQPWQLGLQGWMLFGFGACLWVIGALLWILEPFLWWIQWRQQKNQHGVMLGMGYDSYLPIAQNGRASIEEEGETTVIVWEEDSEDDRNRGSLEESAPHSKV